MAEAAVFSHAVLSHIHSCSAKSAVMICENTKVVQNREGKLSICKHGQIVKGLKDSYGFLGINYEDVGGYWNLSGYYEKAGPCQHKGNKVFVSNSDLYLDTCRKEIGGYQPFTNVTIEVSH